MCFTTRLAYPDIAFAMKSFWRAFALIILTLSDPTHSFLERIDVRIGLKFGVERGDASAEELVQELVSAIIFSFSCTFGSKPINPVWSFTSLMQKLDILSDMQCPCLTLAWVLSLAPSLSGANLFFIWVKNFLSGSPWNYWDSRLFKLEGIGKNLPISKLFSSPLRSWT